MQQGITGTQRRPAQGGVAHAAGWQHTGAQQSGPQATGQQGSTQPQAGGPELVVLTPRPHSRAAQGTQQKAP